MHPYVTRFSALIAGLLVLLLMAGCGQLPRPFQPEAKRVDLKQLNHEVTIVVMPLEGVPAGPNFSTKLVGALQERGLRATTRPDGGANLLQGKAEMIRLFDGSEFVSISLSLTNASGVEIAVLNERGTLEAGQWEEGAPESYQDLVDRTATSLAAQLGLAPDSEIADAQRGRVIVMPVVGPNGSVDEILTVALKAQLRRRSVMLAGEPGPRDVTVEGSVSLNPLSEGWQQVAVVWRVMDAADGEELGKVDQGSKVREGTLDKGFGSSSSLVAAGAAEGISQILEELKVDYFKSTVR